MGFRPCHQSGEGAQYQLEVALHEDRPRLISGLLLKLHGLRGSQSAEQQELLSPGHGLYLEHGVERTDVELDVVEEHEQVQTEEYDSNH